MTYNTPEIAEDWMAPMLLNASMPVRPRPEKDEVYWSYTSTDPEEQPRVLAPILPDEVDRIQTRVKPWTRPVTLN